MNAKFWIRLLSALVLVSTGFVVGRYCSPQPEPVSDPVLATAVTAQSRVPQSSEVPKTREDLQTLISSLKGPASSLSSDDERQRRLEKWAESDPASALAFARTNLKGDRRAQAMSSILAIWGKHDPRAAWDWVKREMPEATHHFDTLLEVFGRNNPATAGAFAAEYAASHPDAALEVHLAALLGVTYSGDFAAARHLVDANPNLSLEDRATLRNFIAGQWGRYAPNEAAAWVLSLPEGRERDQALIGLGESWSEYDAQQATQFAVSLPAGEVRTVALRQAISKWVTEDPVSARNWVLNTDRHEDFDKAVEAVATETNLMSRDPNRSLLWAAGIFDNDLRARTQNAILFNWYAGNPEAATAFIRTSADLTESQRNELLSKLATKG